jgi:hypothetical protein
MKFVSRAYNHFEINPETKSSVIKTSKESRLKDEYLYYENLPYQLEIFFPRIVDGGQKDTGEYFVELEYYAYENLGMPLINNTQTTEFWTNVIDRLFSYINFYRKFPSKSYVNCSKEMYIDKTEHYYSELMNQYVCFLKWDKFFIEENDLLGFSSIWPKIKEYILDNLIENPYYYIHGDFCLSNILYGQNPITNDVVLKFIDPRGKFGNNVGWGHLYYDLAKLSHSFSGGYEYLINDRFDIKFNNGVVNEVQLHNFNEEPNRIFQEKLMQEGFDLLKVKLIEGLIYVGMCSRHYDSIRRQKAMLYTGMKILNDVYYNL